MEQILLTLDGLHSCQHMSIIRVKIVRLITNMAPTVVEMAILGAVIECFVTLGLPTGRDVDWNSLFSNITGFVLNTQFSSVLPGPIILHGRIVNLQRFLDISIDSVNRSYQRSIIGFCVSNKQIECGRDHRKIRRSSIFNSHRRDRGRPISGSIGDRILNYVRAGLTILNFTVIDFDRCCDIAIDFVSCNDTFEVIRRCFVLICDLEALAKSVEDRCDIISHGNNNSLRGLVAALVSSLQRHIVFAGHTKKITGISRLGLCGCFGCYRGSRGFSGSGGFNSGAGFSSNGGFFSISNRSDFRSSCRSDFISSCRSDFRTNSDCGRFSAAGRSSILTRSICNIDNRYDFQSRRCILIVCNRRDFLRTQRSAIRYGHIQRLDLRSGRID